MEEAPCRQFNLVLSFLSFVRGTNTPRTILILTLRSVFIKSFSWPCKLLAERAVPLHVQSRIHLLLRLQQDVCMGEYTDAVLTQALERAAVAVATQQSREDSSRIKNV